MGRTTSISKYIKQISRYRITLISLIVVSTLFDLFTFFYSRLYKYEISPYYLLTGSIIIAVIIKLFLIGVLIWYVLKYSPKKTLFFAYMLMFIVITISISQIIGGFSNLYAKQALEANPASYTPLSTEQAYHTYFLFSLLISYYPLAISLISFYFFEKIYLNSKKLRKVLFFTKTS